MPIFRIDLENILKSACEVFVELGSGPGKMPGRICIDRLELDDVDIVADLEEGLPFFPDNSVDVVFSRNLLEHISNLDVLMQDIWRVLKPDGRACIYVPHFSNPYHYSDFTHQRCFGLYSFEYFSKSQMKFRRKVPAFYHDYGFDTQEIKLVFDSQWTVRRLPRRIVQKLFNLNTWWQEFYEENFCYLFPCYGIEVELKPEKADQ